MRIRHFAGFFVLRAHALEDKLLMIDVQACRVMSGIVIAAAALCACVPPVSQSPQTDEAQQVETSPSRKSPSRVSADLLAIYTVWSRGDEYQNSAYAGRNHATEKGSTVRVKDGRVLVDCTAADDAGLLAAALTELGMTDVAVFKRTVSGWLPIESIGRLETLESLRFARAAAAHTR